MNHYPFTNSLSSIKIIESTAMVERGTPYKVRRTWRERLFSAPWRPSRVFNWITPQVPMKSAMVLACGTMVMHPAIAQALRDSTKEKS